MTMEYDSSPEHQSSFCHYTRIDQEDDLESALPRKQKHKSRARRRQVVATRLATTMALVCMGQWVVAVVAAFGVVILSLRMHG